MKLPLLSRCAIPLLLTALLIAGCKDREPGDGKIPFDRKKALEHIIPVSLGSQYSKNFVGLRDTILPRVILDSSFLPRRFNLPIAETFNRDAIIALLNADGATGVRVYFGNDEKGLVRLVLMPVDKEGKDIITTLVEDSTANRNSSQSKAAAFTEGQSVENGQRPPPPYNALGN